jgi:hypothetical protein
MAARWSARSHAGDADPRRQGGCGSSDLFDIESNIATVQILKEAMRSA